MTAPEATVYRPAAEVYEQHLVPAIFAPWAADLVDLAAPAWDERILDVACGTGIVARTAAGRVGPSATVVGYDCNPAMLAVARRRAAGLEPAIDWREGDATAMAFPDASFDVVLCQQGAQFFSDRVLGCKELHRVTAPTGRVVLSAWQGLEHHAVFGVYDDVLRAHLGAEPLAGSDAPFSFAPDELRGALDAAGFAAVHLRTAIGTVRFASAQHMLDAIGGAHAPVADAVAALAPPAREALVADLTRAMRPYRDDDGIAYPMVSSLALARP